MNTFLKTASKTVIIALVVTLLGVIFAQPANNVQAAGVCWCTGVTAALKGLPSDFPPGWNWDDPYSKYGGVSYLVKNGYVEVNDPKPGDIVVFNNVNHVGVFEQYNSNGGIRLTQNVGNPDNNPPDKAKQGNEVVGHTYYSVGNCTNVGHVDWKKGNSLKFFRKVTGPGVLVLSQPLFLSTTSPALNKSVTATFKVKNVGGTAMTLQSLSAGARRGSDWNGVNVDFPAAANITLQPGQEYSYKQSRSFNTKGAYFAEPVVKINGQWGGIPLANGGFSRVYFNPR